ncbi:endonuclease G, mitochondrial isoform X4 [Phycodurus eques]|nr:endonuclease G, mitochondrial isoform X4 [Phycodurus eques]
MKYGFPSLSNIRTRESYVSSYDPRTRTPAWVIERLGGDTLGGNADRKRCDFKEDDRSDACVRECAGVSVCVCVCARVRAACTQVSACVRPCSVHVFHRATNGDYRGSGLDRGHMAAAANHKWSQKAMDDTFYLTNVAPQNPHMNQNAWNNLEKLCRSLTKLYANVYVCTGPLYLPRQEADGKLYVHYQVLGTNHIAVPTHFFKVLVLERDGRQGGVELRSYVLPNEPVDEKIPLERFLVPIETIERASGLLFLPNIVRTSGGAVTAAANK